MFQQPGEPDHRRQIRDSVADFASREAGSAQVRAALAAPGGFSRQRWKAMADAGWTGLSLSEEWGGLGLDHGDVAALHSEIGRAVMPEPMVVIALLCARALALGDNAPLARDRLPGLLDGAVLTTFAWQKDAGALTSEDVGPIATPAQDGSWTLSGRARFVPIAEAADATVVAAQAPEGTLLAWIDGRPTIDGVIKLADGTPMATVTFDGLVAPRQSVIAGPDRGGAILDTVLDGARLAVSAELLGVTERAFQMTLEHLRTRTQFGKPIGSFQALQHRMVDLYVQIELARSAVHRAAAAFDALSDAKTCAAQAAAAKSRCGEAALRIVRECIQMHGAIGYTDEYDLSLYVRRALCLAAWLGNPRAHRARYAALRNA